MIALGNPGYEWLGDESGYKSMMAATEVWKAMGIEDRIGFDFTGGHDHCQAASSQTQSVTAFVDKFLRGKEAKTDIHVKPSNGKGFKIDNYADWIDWETPTIKYEASAPTTPATDSSATDSSVTAPSDSSAAADSTKPLFAAMRGTAPVAEIDIVGNFLALSGAPVGATVKLFDLQGHLVGVLGETGGLIPRSGKFVAMVLSANGSVLMTKTFTHRER